MNYNSIEEILASGITNMTVIRNNSKQDDGTDTIQGVDWFSYNGTVASNIYASGNSFIGFGSSSEHLKVNRRDGAMWYLYREEGTLYGYYKFLKIRWSGYTNYNQTTSPYLLTYDVILWDTGDISLHIIDYPTSYNTGTYTLGSTSYTVNASKPDVTFTKTDSGYTASNNIINLALPFKKLYLIRSNSDYYTISNGVLSKIETAELTSDIFLTHGLEEITNTTLLLNLPNPELLFWTDSDLCIPEQLVVSLDPPIPQVVYYDPYTIPEGYSISIAETIAKDALFAVTFDGGVTWKYLNNNIWTDASTESEGMTADVLKGMSQAKWDEISTSSVQFRCSLMSLEATAGPIAMGYN